ncbi:glycoside hydrolase family 15 protein [Paraburkholderia sp. MMS20-SJTN17]|uniref:Glycoside hydrolase family 15 protein n=1 Tax=Paraburkholderia translucens TaxID=2886945 RepID=A0ABS8KM85_9BURK|nr:glycoside hydrolase family 15 protein [Paraburkholderia sp. MMS20-SJTN17]
MAWRDWLVRAVAGHPSDMQIVYAVDGSRHIAEWICDWLPGYEGATPVRFGNLAVSQSQHDIYGEVMNALYVARRHGLPPDDDVWELERRMADHVGRIWREPDNGLWELRREPRHYTLSKAMCWVALDRAIRCARDFGEASRVAHWKHLAARLHRDICQRGFNRALNCFTQSYGSDQIDASLLLLPLFGFLPVDDPRIAATVDAIERNLMKDGLVRRYRSELPEGAFLACSLWLVQIRKMQGRDDTARELFDRVVALRNDVGLLAEEYDTSLNRQCGNFPLTLSHVALIGAAHALDDVDYLALHR